MKKDQIEIIESTISHVLRIRPGKINEYSFREKNGYIKREAGKDVILESGEFTSRSELVRILPENLKRKFFTVENESPELETGSTSRATGRIRSFLNKVPGLEWEIIFKVLSKRKYIKNRGIPSGSPGFQHHSLLVRFKKCNWNNFIEIGEGDTNGSDFNISGLISRFDEIIKCNSDSGKRKLPEDLPLILSPGEGGIIFHEILGHSLEADHVYRGLSPFKVSDVGRKVVSDNITLSTFREGDPFFRNVKHDDEGISIPEVPLIKNGVLRHFISDTGFSKTLGIKDAGHSRMENFTKSPMPRMYAIYLENGKYSRDELMNSTDKGVYAKEFGDGKVLFHKNRFYFNIPSAYMIKNGRIREPLGSIIVSGKINEVFNSVEMVGNDFSLDRGISYCYKDGQTLNVRVGQPSVKINNLDLSRGFYDI